MKNEDLFFMYRDISALFDDFPISMGEGKFEIDAAKCVDCGSCAGQCPVGAISEG